MPTGSTLTLSLLLSAGSRFVFVEAKQNHKWKIWFRVFFWRAKNKNLIFFSVVLRELSRAKSSSIFRRKELALLSPWNGNWNKYRWAHHILNHVPEDTIRFACHVIFQHSALHIIYIGTTCLCKTFHHFPLSVANRGEHLASADNIVGTICGSSHIFVFPLPFVGVFVFPSSILFFFGAPVTMCIRHPHPHTLDTLSLHCAVYPMLTHSRRKHRAYVFLISNE